MKLSYISLIACILISLNSYSQTDKEVSENPELSETAKIKSELSLNHVSDSIFMLKGKGGNIGLSFGSDGVFMIDSQFANATPAILATIRELSNRPVQILINTHLHGDHVGGNKNMTNHGALIISHANVRDRIIANERRKVSEGQEEKLEQQMVKLEGDANKNKTSDKEIERRKMQLQERYEEAFKVDEQILPSLTYKEDIDMYFNGNHVMIFHVHNAHTDGDSMVYFMDSNVLHTGDAFVNGMYPYLDTKSGGSYKGYVEGLSKVLMLINSNTKIIPGHGQLATKKDVEEMKKMLETYYQRISLHYYNDKTEDEVARMRDFTSFYDDKGYGDGFISTEKILRAIYKEVAKDLKGKKNEMKNRADLRKKIQDQLKEKDGN